MPVCSASVRPLALLSGTRRELGVAFGCRSCQGQDSPRLRQSVYSFPALQRPLASQQDARSVWSCGDPDRILNDRGRRRATAVPSSAPDRPWGPPERAVRPARPSRVDVPRARYATTTLFLPLLAATGSSAALRHVLGAAIAADASLPGISVSGPCFPPRCGDRATEQRARRQVLVVFARWGSPRWWHAESGLLHLSRLLISRFVNASTCGRGELKGPRLRLWRYTHF